ncbi:MAG: hypothetical protein P8P24_08210, partial [Planktomarina sp.]|nr:hypothetical protein [Planktomarina sp.]
ETVESIMMGGRLNGNPLAQDFTICAPTADILKDLAGGYITAEAAETIYGLAPQQIADILARAKNGEEF